MPTSITSNPFPLGSVTGTPGTPVRLTANIPDFDTDYVNHIKIQSHPSNTGKVYLGNATLDVSADTGILHVLMVPGDTIVMSSFAINVYRLSDFRLDFEDSGDKAIVSVYVR
jgi:hypothetical protein